MRICHCHGVTDRELAAAVRSVARGGSDGSSALLAGSGCGGCLPLVEEITTEVLAECAGKSPIVSVQFPILQGSDETDLSIHASVG